MPAEALLGLSEAGGKKGEDGDLGASIRMVHGSRNHMCSHVFTMFSPTYGT